MPNIHSKYQVQGLEVRLEKIGTKNKPFLYAITSGQQNQMHSIVHTSLHSVLSCVIGIDKLTHLVKFSFNNRFHHISNIY